MSISRADSQHPPPPHGRRRSNTIQSTLKPVTPASFGASEPFNLWVHEPSNGPDVVFNHDVWPAVAKGDMIQVSSDDMDLEGGDGLNPQGFLFIVPANEGHKGPSTSQLQVCATILQCANVFDCSSRLDIRCKTHCRGFPSAKPCASRVDQGSLTYLPWHPVTTDTTHPGNMSLAGRPRDQMCVVHRDRISRPISRSL